MSLFKIKFNDQGLSKDLEWVLNARNYSKLCQNAREKVRKEFDSYLVAQKYVELYKEILNKI